MDEFCDTKLSYGVSRRCSIVHGLASVLLVGLLELICSIAASDVMSNEMPLKYYGNLCRNFSPKMLTHQKTDYVHFLAQGCARDKLS